ncbi:hypothetical protein K432DRAFT_390463 [Lepidopterella palustris CBS 459.81]|uniref:Uncharacterized protein n=1 Tax=Lepidopterella palustris CBS 459.81 TaxID=1314670 RepID=A0A8E2JI41_9PEZI|nr:hypothetical protein K432DRAFT_390463 [Lepidopterella palustris CBS 459.81]
MRAFIRLSAFCTFYRVPLTIRYLFAANLSVLYLFAAKNQNYQMANRLFLQVSKRIPLSPGRDYSAPNSISTDPSNTASDPESRLPVKRKAQVHLYIIHSRSRPPWLPDERPEELKWWLDGMIPAPTGAARKLGDGPIVAEWVGSGDCEWMGVVVSGPDGMNRDVRNACAGLLVEIHQIERQGIESSRTLHQIRGSVRTIAELALVDRESFTGPSLSMPEKRPNPPPRLAGIESRRFRAGSTILKHTIVRTQHM